MKNRFKIVRNSPVFCAESVIKNILKDSKANRKAVRAFSKDEILSQAFGEDIGYDSLCAYYLSALQGIDNCYFSSAYFFDKTHAIRVDEDNKVLLYYYQDILHIGIPWNYPHKITCIGYSDEGTPLCTVIDDLKQMCIHDFLLKYYIKKENVHDISRAESGCFIGNIKILIDEHIVFQWQDDIGIIKELYIADSWYYSTDQILADTMRLNLLEFGRKYCGFWGK